MFEHWKENFKEPKGWIGKMVGKLMAYENKTLNEWTIHQLNISSGESVLEVGYGPGYSLEYMLEHFPNVKLDGVDISETMKEEASQRLRMGIDKGCVQLFAADIAEVHLPKAKYQKVMTVNNYTLWEEPIVGLQNIYQALQPGGKIAITMQPRQEDAEAEQDKTKQFANQIQANLKTTHFHSIKLRYKELIPTKAVCITAIK